MNYADYISAGNAPTLPVQSFPRRGELHACPVCGVFVQACRLASLAGLPAEFAGGAAWACDACLAGWRAGLVPIAPGDQFVVAEEWFQRFVELTGGDAGPRDAILGQAYAREADRLAGLLAGLAPDAPERADLESRAALVAERGTLPGAWSKTAIAADGVDAAVLSGVPAGTVVSVDGVDYPVADGAFELSASTPGAFVVDVRHPRYIWQRVEIHAD